MAFNDKKTNIQDVILQHIKDAIEDSIVDIFDEAVEKATNDALAKRDELVAQTALKMSNWVQMQENKTNLVITIEKPKD